MHPTSFDSAATRHIMYCPYCNKHDRDDMTDEHVIPQSIGGSNKTIIKVYKACNSTVGTRADAFLARHSGLRFISMMHRKPSIRPRRLEGHPSYGELEGGTRLKGHVHVEYEDKTKFRFVFEPSGIQDDGKKWMTEEQLAGHTGPPDARILDPDEVEWTSFEFNNGQGEGMESGMLKILLEICYLADGAKLVSLPSLDPIRNSLDGQVDPRIRIQWIDPKTKHHLLPLACENSQHLIWEACPDGDQFDAGVCLYGRLCMAVLISNFGAK